MPEAVAFDGAVAASIIDVVDRFTQQFENEGAFRAEMSLNGIESADADSLWAFASGPGGGMTTLRSELKPLLAILRAPKPNFALVVPKAAGMWRQVTSLVDLSPDILVGEIPYFELALRRAIEDTVQSWSPGLWMALRAFRLVGPDVDIAVSLKAIFDDPLKHFWNEIKTARRQYDLTFAGFLTGPRASSLVTLPIGDTGGVSPAITTKFPNATQLLTRVVFRFASDTYAETTPITLEVVGDSSTPPAFVAAALFAPVKAEPINFGSFVTARISADSTDLGFALNGNGDFDTLDSVAPKLTIGANFPNSLVIGDPNSLGLLFDKPLFDASFNATGWAVRAGFEEFKAKLSTGAVPVVGMLLPAAGLEVRGKLLLRYDQNGLSLDGGVKLQTTWPGSFRLPGLQIHSLTTAISPGGGKIGLSAAGTVVVGLGPMTVTIEGLGLQQEIAIRADGKGNAGILDFGSLAIAGPTGIGIRLDASIVKGGGLLRVEGEEMAGALQLALTLGSVEIDVKAVGVLGRVEGRTSLIVVMSVEFNPAIEIFLGITLNAVGGVVGINRAVDTDALGGVVRSGQVGDLMFPKNLLERANEVINSVKAVYPPRADQYVVGPMLRIGWGRPTSFITAEVAILVTFPRPSQLLILGQFRLDLPAEGLSLIHLQAGFAGGLDFDSGNVWFDASLERSRIGMFDVTGDICLRAGASGFLFSAGGFHPRFHPPATIPALRRLGIAISPSPILQIGAEAYFAITASTVQFGAALHARAKLGPIGATGQLALDVLIQTSPKLSFVAELNGAFSLTYKSHEIASAHLNVLLEGPGRWHAHAHASIEILFIEVSGSIDLAWGEDAKQLLEPVNVAKAVSDALDAPHVWTNVIPATDAGMVNLRSGAKGLHPLGSLRLTQTVAPLGVPLQRFGARPVSGSNEITAEFGKIGLEEPIPAEELFAPAQFFDLSDDERLSKPAFVPMKAGAILKRDAYGPVQDIFPATVVYEESTDEGSGPLRGLVTAGPKWMGWTVSGAAARNKPDSGVPRTIRNFEVRDPAYAIADAATGERLSSASPATLVDVSTRRSADRVLLASYEFQDVA